MEGEVGPGREVDPGGGGEAGCGDGLGEGAGLVEGRVVVDNVLDHLLVVLIARLPLNLRHVDTGPQAHVFGRIWSICYKKGEWS